MHPELGDVRRPTRQPGPLSPSRHLLAPLRQWQTVLGVGVSHGTPGVSVGSLSAHKYAETDLLAASVFERAVGNEIDTVIREARLPWHVFHDLHEFRDLPSIAGRPDIQVLKYNIDSLVVTEHTWVVIDAKNIQPGELFVSRTDKTGWWRGEKEREVKRQPWLDQTWSELTVVHAVAYRLAGATLGKIVIVVPEGVRDDGSLLESEVLRCGAVSAIVSLDELGTALTGLLEHEAGPTPEVVATCSRYLYSPSRVVEL